MGASVGNIKSIVASWVMKVLTYNISWEGMTGRDSRTAKGTKCIVDGVNKCNPNVLSVLKPEYDFLCLQEASGVPADFLSATHERLEYTDGMETAIMFHKKEYVRQKSFTGNFDEVGRPFLIAIFEKFVVISVHPGHHIATRRVFSILETALKDEDITRKEIIIAGDFNVSIGPSVIVFGRTLKREPGMMYTCCDSEFGENPLYIGSFDHILVSEPSVLTSATLPIPAETNTLFSDHLPLLADIELKPTPPPAAPAFPPRAFPPPAFPPPAFPPRAFPPPAFPPAAFPPARPAAFAAAPYRPADPGALSNLMLGLSSSLVAPPSPEKVRKQKEARERNAIQEKELEPYRKRIGGCGGQGAPPILLQTDAILPPPDGYPLCIRLPREDWVPPESRKLGWMMENRGTDSAHSFVYFPKETLTVRGVPIHCLRIPVGAQFYKGFKFGKCSGVEDPAVESCERCECPLWYSDFHTAAKYASGNPARIFSFEAMQELFLVNMADPRNIRSILSFFISKLGTLPDRKDIEPPMAEYVEWMYDFKKYFGYQFTPEEKEAIVQKIPDNDEARIFRIPRPIENPPDPSPEEAALVATEFGDSSVLDRFSTFDGDLDIITYLMYFFDGSPVAGYYAPIMPSFTHILNARVTDPACPKTLTGFAREMALFSSKGMMKHNKSNPLDGCMVDPSGGKRNRKTRRKKKHVRKTRKHF